MPVTQDTIGASHLATGRAVDQLRRQLGIVFKEQSGNLLGACPIEGLSEGLLAELRGPAQRLSLLITAARTRSLGYGVKTDSAVRIDAANLSLSDLLALSDPLANTAPKIVPAAATPSQHMLMTLAKYASLLPALLLVESARFPDHWLSAAESEVREYWNAPPLDIVPLAHASLPIEGAENATLTCFRTRYGTSTHLALTIGDIGAAPLVRVHSSCITGDILGSLRCDCGDQLALALEQIKSGGILIYLHQEGRGIGIANKLRAYQLQERGIDTYEANLMLGFDEDERDFAIAAAILKKLNAHNIRLLTNNPKKITALETYGITIKGRVPLAAPFGKHNHAYIEAKTKKAGHLF